jgi:DNA-directed RNA polymerase subunit RPC12/RpoP
MIERYCEICGNELEEDEPKDIRICKYCRANMTTLEGMGF